MSEKLLIFIPCYNCGTQVARVLHQFEKLDGGWFSEILVLDNGSKDNTIQSAIEASKSVSNIDITIARNRENYNLGGSHKAAFRHASDRGFTHVVVLHGDDQGDIRDLIRFLKTDKYKSMDACLGARFMKGSKLIGYSKFRIFGNHVFNTLFTMGTGNAVNDLGSGLNMFGRQVFEDPRILFYADDLRFNIYLLLGLFSRKFKVKYFPISWREEDQVSNVKMTSQALKTVDLLLSSIFNRKEFNQADHRDVKYSSYQFDVVYAALATPGHVKQGGQ